MKKLIRICSLSGALFSIILVAVLVSPNSSFASATNYEINFNMDNANKSVFYDSSAHTLSASDISVTSVTSINTPLNSSHTLSLINTVLTFTFVDDTNEGTISLTENPQNPAIIFSGIFTDGSVTQSGSKSGIKTIFSASFSNDIGDALASYFGLPSGTGAYQGNISFVINNKGNFTTDPKSLTNTTSVPLPSAGLLLAAGLIGLISVRRKEAA